MVNTFMNTADAVQGADSELSIYRHPDYTYSKVDWDLIRDAMLGERRVKERGELYLPALDVEGGTSYQQYKSRAVFVNMVSRTVMGLTGTVFRRNAKVDMLDRTYLENVSLEGLDFNAFARKCCIEICGIGRVGVLVDMAADGSKPYLAEYIAENILSWKTKIVNGRKVPVYALLREIRDTTPTLGVDDAKPSEYVSTNITAGYRALYLDAQGIYRQKLYREDEITVNQGRAGYGPGSTQKVLVSDGVTITPTNRGKPFDYIPMRVMGPQSASWDVQRSPVLDITTLNYAHYRTSAQLEHGRFFTALPVYYVPITSQDDKAVYEIGPSVVWEVPDNTKPGILEYFGTGLKNLADSLIEKEEAISQLGGRLMGIRAAATTESEDIFKMKQANEMAILLGITESMMAGLTDCLTWYLQWQQVQTVGIDDDGNPWRVRVQINQDFKDTSVAARELRAVALLYQQGMLPISEVFNSLQGAGFINDDLSLEEFELMLKNVENFPNQPDVQAMHEGFPDRKAQLNHELTDRQMRQQMRQDEMDRDHALLIQERKAEQASDLQEEGFKQGLHTTEFETAQLAKLESTKATIAATVGNVSVTPAPAAPAASKPAAAPRKASGPGAGKKPAAPKKPAAGGKPGVIVKPAPKKPPVPPHKGHAPTAKDTHAKAVKPKK